MRVANLRCETVRQLATAGLLALLAWVVSPHNATAQPMRAEAAVGQPFGIGRVEFDLPATQVPPGLGYPALTVNDPQNRIYYPAVNAPNVGKVVREILDQTRRPLAQAIGSLFDRPPRVTIYFLFVGLAPLDLTVNAAPPFRIRVQPVDDPRLFGRLTAAWWRHYTAPPSPLQKKADYPPMVENYLQATLMRRLGLPWNSPRRAVSWQKQFERELGLMLSTEPMRAAMLQERILGGSHQEERAELPLPAAVAVSGIEPVPVGDDVKIEPIALRVPDECLYVRFGSFTNFLWFQDTLGRWGGDLNNLIETRGLDYGQNEKFQRQIVLKQTALARVFGEAAVADAAIVGADTFMAEGSAMGILFQARTGLLRNDLLGQRRDALKNDPSIREEKLKIAGREVSLLSTPDNRVRSFFAENGDYLLVTNSRWLVERFVQIADGKGSLGALAEFRQARAVMPTSRNDSVFVYVPDRFFRRLISPQYRIEIARRLRAESDIELLQLARLNSATEGKPGDTVEQLIAGGYLPPDFGPRPDGSRTLSGGGQVYDSLRGGRGTFLPVADVPVESVTPSENEAYARFAEYFSLQVGRIDPLMVGLKHQPVAGKPNEMVTIDAVMAPLNRSRYDKLMQTLGPDDKLQMAPIEGDMVAIDAVLSRQRLFGALRDFAGNPGLADEVLATPLSLFPVNRLRDLLYGYIGSTSQDLGYLSILNAGMGPPDASGFARSALGLFRLQTGPYTLFSFQPDVLATVGPQVRFIEAERPAQIRLRAADISQANFVPLVNALVFGRSRETTLGNLRLIEAMRQQLHVPDDDALAAAEALLGAKLVCPLGGQYTYQRTPEGVGYWTSTALDRPAERRALMATPPNGYTAQALTWFRGMMAELTLVEGKAAIHAEVEMAKPAKTAPGK